MGVRHAELGDIATQFYPWRTSFNTAVGHGEIPLWNPQVLMGAPYLALPLSELFFPLNWLYAVLSGPVAWSVLFIVRAAIIAVAMAVFIKRMGGSTAGALLSGFTFALCGWVTAFQGRPQIDTAMWLPLMFLAIDEIHKKPAGRAIALGAIAFALPVLGGHPEIAFQVILLACLYAVYRAFPISRTSIRYMAAFVSAGCIGVLLAAVQLVPTLEWMGLITRTLKHEWGHLPAGQLISFFSRDMFHHPNVDGVFIPEGAAYAGFVTLAITPFALFWERRKDVLFFFFLAFLCIEIAYGGEPFYWIVSHTPILEGLPNWRFLVGADFGLAVLLGLGVSALEGRCARSALRSRGPMAVTALLAAGIAAVLIALRVTGHTAVPYWGALACIAAALVIAAFAATGRIRATSFTRWIALVALADLFTAGYGYIPFVRKAAIFPPAPVFDFLQKHADGNWRVGSVDLTYGNNFEIPYNLSTATGYDFPTARVARFLSAFNAGLGAISFDSERLLEAPEGALDLTSTRFFVATRWNRGAARLGSLPSRFQKVFENGTEQIFENPKALPEVFLVPKDAITVVTSEEAQFREVLGANFDPRQSLISPYQVRTFFGLRGNVPESAARIVAQTSNATVISAAAAHDSLLVFNETHYPGWSVEVDGSPGTVIRANYAFMAVPICAGAHTIRFHFEPASFRIGAVLSALGLILLAGLILWRRVNMLDSVRPAA